MKLITKNLEAKLIANALNGDDTGGDKPPLKLFAPWGAATWLISEYDPKTRTMFGLCDLGHNCAELGYVSLDELEDVSGPFGLKIERDTSFEPSMTLGEYAAEARECGYIAA